jgi:hypothetical protein
LVLSVFQLQNIQSSLSQELTIIKTSINITLKHGVL